MDGGALLTSLLDALGFAVVWCGALIEIIVNTHGLLGSIRGIGSNGSPDFDDQ